MNQWIAQPENQIFLFGMVLMLLGAFTLVCVAFPRTIEEPAVEPVQWNSHTIVDDPGPPPANYHRDDLLPLAGYLTAAIDADADAITDVIEAFDPLDVTTELEHIDPSVPLFYTIRRPAPYVAESFTEGITRAQIERAIAAGRPE